MRPLAAMVRPAGVLLACLPPRRDLSLRHTLIINGTYPRRWLHWYLATHADRFDPVLQQMLATGVSFTWDTQRLHDRLSPAERTFLAAAADYGLSAGAIGACTSPSGWLSFLALAGPPACPYRQWLQTAIWLIHSAHPALIGLARQQARRMLLHDHEILLLHALQCTTTIRETAILRGATEQAAHQTLWRLMQRTGFCRVGAIRHLAAWQPIAPLELEPDGIAAPANPMPQQLSLL